jgi:hypothetical protein
MTDMRADDRLDEDRLPWLEAVDEPDEQVGPSPLKLIAFVIIGLIAIGVFAGGLVWLGSREGVLDGGAAGGGASGGDVIAAPEGPFKIRPPERGGMQVEGEGDTAFVASEGGDPNARLNTNALPEAPVATPAPAPQPNAAAPAAPKAQAPAPRAAAPAPAPQPAVAGGSIQLGAFSTPSGANEAWRALSSRFRYLAPLSHSVAPAQVGGRTLYRLRASGPDAAGVCRRLQVAGEDCTVL